MAGNVEQLVFGIAPFSTRKSISELIMDYFQGHPGEDLCHKPVVDWVSLHYERQTGQKPSDPWRAIRKLSQQGKLLKVKKGVYRYEPSLVRHVDLWDFSAQTRAAILQRDAYRCVICGRGPEDGVELAVDHIKPKDHGGTNDISNGQTLCTEHNLLKKNFSQTETAKRFFTKVYRKAIESQDEHMMAFCTAILDVYDAYQIDTHIRRPDEQGAQTCVSEEQQAFSLELL